MVFNSEALSGRKESITTCKVNRGEGCRDGFKINVNIFCREIKVSFVFVLLTLLTTLLRWLLVAGPGFLLSLRLPWVLFFLPIEMIMASFHWISFIFVSVKTSPHCIIPEINLNSRSFKRSKIILATSRQFIFLYFEKSYEWYI
jgi:hypothetical protein